jgi:hypothetical protein
MRRRLLTTVSLSAFAMEGGQGAHRRRSASCGDDHRGRWVGCRSNIVVPRRIVSADRPMSMNSPAHADERTFQSGFAEAPLIPWLDDP